MEDKKNTAELIKSKISCFDLIDEFNIECVKTGDSYRCKSFTHNGSNPTSCQIWHDSWYCHSDKMSGDVISMYAYLKFNGDNSLAFKDLMYRLGIGSEQFQEAEYKQYVSDMQRIADNVEQYHKNLKPEHINYLHGRKIKDEYINSHKIGYDPTRGRIIIPVFKNDRPIYWCGRAYDKTSLDGPKYLKETLGSSSYLVNELYGYDTLKRNNKDVWVAEGVFDFASLDQEGKSVLSNATGMSNAHIETVIKIAKEDFKWVNVCYDNDTQGNKFSEKMMKNLFENLVPFKIIQIPKEYEGEPIKDISDAYCAGLKPDRLIENYSIEGVEYYMGQKYDEFEDAYEFINKNSPYMNRRFKNSVKTFIDLTFPNKEDKKILMQALNRAKTQDEIANEFIQSYPHRLWYSEKVGLMEYTGTHWQELSEVTLHHYLTVKFPKLKSSDEKQIFDKVKFKSVDKDNPTINDKECFNVANGTIYFDPTNKDQPYVFVNSHDPKDYCNYCRDFEYNPNADTQFIDDMLGRVFKDHPSGCENMIQRVKEHLGSLFFRENIEQKIAMYVGEGANGKSMISLMFESLLGEELYSATELQSFTKEFGLQNLIGKYLNCFHDVKSNTFDCEDILKNIASNDTININIKYKAPVSVRLRCNILIDANAVLKPKDKSDGFIRRFLDTTYRCYNVFTSDEKLIGTQSFDERDNVIHYFERDGRFRDSLLEHKDAILNYALEGYCSIVRNDKTFTPVPEDKYVYDELLSSRGPMYQFALEYDFWKVHKGAVTYEQLYLEYKSWCLENSSSGNMYSKNTFTSRIFKEFEKAGRKVERYKSMSSRGIRDVYCKKNKK